MSPVLAQRQLGLAAVALLGVVAALAIAHQRSATGAPPSALPQPAAASGDWYRALAGVERGLPARSPCGLLAPGTLGIAHPVLPCGTKLYVAYGRKTVLTEVVDRGPSGNDREFDLTPALARELGLQGIQRVRWAFARG